MYDFVVWDIRPVATPLAGIPATLLNCSVRGRVASLSCSERERPLPSEEKHASTSEMGAQS